MAYNPKIFLGPSVSGPLIAGFLAVTATAIGYTMWLKSNTLPALPVKEGFGGVAVGSGVPDCLRASSEGAQIAGFFAGKTASLEEGSDDLRELMLLLSKLACLKKDLLAVGGVIEATRYQAYATSHDIEPVAETTARCFAKTMPPRDLDIIFEKWEQRGNILLRRLCSSYDVTPDVNNKLKKWFAAMIIDVKDIATGACFVGTPIINGKTQGRTTSGYEPPELIDLGPYKGRY
jgi:hypothetical protein